MAEWREKAKEHQGRPDVIEGLRQGAKGLTARAALDDRDHRTCFRKNKH